MVDAGIVVGDPHQQAGDGKAGERAPVDVEAGRADRRIAERRAQAEHQGRDREQGHGRDRGRTPEALVEGAHDVVRGAELDEVGAGDRGQQADAADHQREHHQRGLLGTVEEDRPQQHRGDEGDRVGLEQVGRHAGAVADIVADIVRDHGRVARVILGDAGLDLADEVGADVGTLGEDAAAEPGEDRDQRGAEGEADQGLQDAPLLDPEGEQEAVIEGDAEQAQGHDQEAGDRPRLEGHVQAAGEPALGRGLGGADVGPHRDVHADIAGGGREAGADHVADADRDAEEEGQEQEDDHADGGDGHVLAIEIGAGTLLDGGGDLLHPRVPGRHGQHQVPCLHAIGDASTAAQYDEHVEDPFKS